MASKGKKSPRDLAIDGLTRITRAKPHPKELWAVIVEAKDSLTLSGESASLDEKAARILKLAGVTTMPDATFALIVSTAIDQALELAISTHFPIDYAAAERMFDENANGPLGTFGAKIKTAYALGLYPVAVKEELDLIRHIRNAFAHSWYTLEFTDQPLIDACEQLRLPQSYNPGPFGPKLRFTPKSRFLYSAQAVFEYLALDSADGPILFSSHPKRELFESVQQAYDAEKSGGTQA